MLEKSTYYVLDAQGNCMNVYEHEVDAQDVLFSLKERHIFGNSTLGIYDDSVNIYTTTPSNLLSTTLGKKFYQMSDHRGNVNTVISDIKTPISTGTTVDYYEAYIVNIADYSGFGVELDGRAMKSEFYRRGFQNQEVDSEIKGEGNSVNYKYRMHDPRVGRFFAVDPLGAKYPHNSPFSFSENVVINAVELEGLERAYVYNMVKKRDLWVKTYSHEELNEDLVERYQYKYQYWDQEGNIIETKIEERAASQINPNLGFYDNLIDYHLNEGNYFQALKWKAKKTDDAIHGPEEFGEGLKLIGATVGTIFSAGTLNAAIASGGLLTLGTATATEGLLLSFDEFSGVGKEESWLESTIRDNLGDTSADLLKGAKIAINIKNAAKGVTNFTVKLAGGEMIDGTFDVLKQTYSIGNVVGTIKEEKAED